MPFGASFVTPNQTQTSENVFMRLREGKSIVRIVSDQEQTYLAVVMKVSLGGDIRDWRTIACETIHPAIRNLANSDTGDERPIRIQRRYVMNVLDRTDRSVAPQLKLLDVGRAVMEQFVQIANQLLDPRTAEPLPIQRCDLIITTTGTGLRTKRTVFPDLTPEGLKQIAAPTDLINPFDHIFFFTPDEQMALLNGANYTEMLAEKRKPLFP